MPLDPYLADRLHLLENLGFHAMTDEMTARMAQFYVDPEPWTVPAGVTTRDGEVAGPHGPVPYRLYSPSTTPTRTLVWAHGGGFATGDLESPEAHVVSAELAARSGACVVSVDYRVAQNGVRYPVPLDDVHAVVTAALAGGIGDVASGWVGVGGASAGAALALASALRCVHGPGPSVSAVLLAYPMVHFPNPGLEPDVAAELSVLPVALRTPPSGVAWMVENYVGRLGNLPAEALPGSSDLTGLPPTRLVVSEYDDLRASAELLERQLREVGVDVRSYLAAGMVHGHLNRIPMLTQVDRSLSFLAEALS